MRAITIYFIVLTILLIGTISGFAWSTKDLHKLTKYSTCLDEDGNPIVGSVCTTWEYPKTYTLSKNVLIGSTVILAIGWILIAWTRQK